MTPATSAMVPGYVPEQTPRPDKRDSVMGAALIIFALSFGSLGGLVGVSLILDRVSAYAQRDVGALVGPGFSRSFEVTCATTATAIQAPGGAQMSYVCQNITTTPVYVGDSGLASTTAPRYCKADCPAEEFGGNVRQECCLVASGTVDVQCRALVAVSSAP